MLKLYRKLLVLAVLSGSLFIFSSLNPASASICCTDLHAICDQWYDDCVADCNVYQGIPQKYAICVNACESSRLNCYGFNCDITC